MADKKISELVSLAGGDLSDADLIPVVDVSTAEAKAVSISGIKAAFAETFSSLFPGKNIYNFHEEATGFYLRATDGAEIADADSTISGYIPIESSTQYTWSGLTLTGTKAMVFYDAAKVKLPPVGVNYEDVVLNGAMTTPVTAKFVRRTVVFNGVGNTTSVQLELGAVATVFEPYSRHVADTQIRATPDNTTFFASEKNLFSEAVITEGSLLSNGDGLPAVAAGWAYAKVPIARGDVPYISVTKGASNVSTTDDALHFYNAGGARIGTTGNLSLEIPVGAVTLGFNISNTVANLPLAKATIQVEYSGAPTSYAPRFPSKRIAPSYRGEATDILRGKIITWVGDSIVKGDSYTDWHDLSDALYGSASINKGDSGATIAYVVGRSCMSGALLTYQYNTATALTLIAGGTNDWSSNVPLGTNPDMLGSVDTTVKGSLYKAIAWLKANNPTGGILIMTPLERGGSAAAVNSIGLTLKAYRDAIIEVCAAHGVPYVDNWALSPVNRFTADKFLYDGLHPNNEGYAISLPIIITGMCKALLP